MCEPVTVMAIGLGISAVGTVAQAQAQKAQADHQAALYAKTANEAADAGERAGELVALDAGAAGGRQKARIGASNLSVNSGSPLEAIADSAMYGELDKETAQANAQAEADRYRYAGVLSLEQGRAAQLAGAFNTAGVLATGGAQIGNYYKQAGK